MPRAGGDQSYIFNLLDELIGEKSLREYRGFDFLRGDSGRRLPVDGYYPNLNLVIEFDERQHREDVPFFNRRNTVSGVDRGEQRRIYDQRRDALIPEHNIRLFRISNAEFDLRKKKLRRTENDKIKLRDLLSKAGII